MDLDNNGNVSVAEAQMLLGEKDILIYALQKQLRAALARIAELEKPKDTQ